MLVVGAIGVDGKVVSGIVEVGKEGNGNVDTEGDGIIGYVVKDGDGTVGRMEDGAMVPERVVGNEVSKKNDGNDVGLNSKDGDRLYVG